MSETINKLAECRYCGSLCRVGNTTGGCPNCGYNEVKCVEFNSLEGGTVTKEKPWYRVFELVGEE